MIVLITPGCHSCAVCVMQTARRALSTLTAALTRAYQGRTQTKSWRDKALLIDGNDTGCTKLMLRIVTVVHMRCLFLFMPAYTPFLHLTFMHIGRPQGHLMAACKTSFLGVMWPGYCLLSIV